MLGAAFAAFDRYVQAFWQGATLAIRRSDRAMRDRWPWLLFMLAGFTATGLFALDIARDAMLLAVAFGAITAVTAGILLHRPRPRRPWVLFDVACVLFIIGAIVRPVVVQRPGLAPLWADLATVPGFFCLIASLVSFLYARRGIERHALIDGLIVCTGVSVGSTLLLALPAASFEGRHVVVSAVAGVYPLLDAILLLLVINLAFTTAVRRPAQVMLIVAIVFVSIGDLGYSIIGASGQLIGPKLLDVPFVFAFALGGAAALHPSAKDLGSVAPVAVQAWSWSRLLLIGPALCVPFVMTAVVEERSLVQRLVLAVGGATVVLLLIVRAASAVRSNAAAQRRYQHQATHDPLTGLPNRRMLTDAVDRIIATAQTADGSLIWMFFLDLDGFKFVNDSWGHPAGDQLIIDVGQRLRVALPESATVARVGGDEFVIVKLCDQLEAMALAKTIMDSVQEPLRVANAEVVISASMGIASAEPLGASALTAEGLMRDADTAMYRTKSEGRGRWTVFDASMHEAVRERIEIEVALRTAVAQEDLFLEYQPIVDLPSGAPLGAEALVRWNHPERGPIAPNIFIPIAEDSSLIIAIGTWVLRDSIRQLAAWRADGVVREDFWMSINVSPRQLIDPALPGLVADELERRRVPAGRIVLEITESVMIEASAVTDRILFDLRVLGVRLSVDDFGTGFSALGYLRRHPVTGVKIDRSFVAGLGMNAEDEEIVRAVVAMSAALGLSVVAEGVETEAQRAVLASLGVTLGQGWLWGRAVGPERFAERWTPVAAGRRGNRGTSGRQPLADQGASGSQAAGNS